MDEPGISIAKFPQGNGAMDDELKKVRLKVKLKEDYNLPHLLQELDKR
jgi:hypothetical protein